MGDSGKDDDRESANQWLGQRMFLKPVILSACRTVFRDRRLFPLSVWKKPPTPAPKELCLRRLSGLLPPRPAPRLTRPARGRYRASASPPASLSSRLLASNTLNIKRFLDSGSSIYGK